MLNLIPCVIKLPQIRKSISTSPIEPVGLNFCQFIPDQMFRYEQIVESKPKLLSLIIFSVIGILAVPIIVPNIFHGNHFFHIILHLTGIIVAVFLSIISIIAYSRVRTKRLLFTMIAFSIFVVAESFSLVDATWPFTFYFGQVSIEEASHLLIITMLGIFTLAVFRKD